MSNVTGVRNAVAGSPEPFLTQAREARRMRTEIYSIASAARDFFGGQISPWTLRSWIRLGKLRSYKAGSRVILKREDLEAFLKAREVQSAVSRGCQ
jgi:excisionase family DNA binding protein